MHAVDTGFRALRLEALQLVAVAHGGRDQAAVAGQLFRFVQQGALRGSADRHFAVFAALGPAIFQAQLVAEISPGRYDLDAFLAPQPEGCFQAQGHGGIPVADFLQLVCIEYCGLGYVGDVHAIGDAIRIVLPGEEISLVGFFCPPAQRAHAVLDGAGGKSFGAPALQQGVDMLGLQAVGVHVQVAQLMQLVGDQGEQVLASACVV